MLWPRRVARSIEPLAQRAIGAYLGLAVGDALGATVEFMTPLEIKAQYGVHREMIGGGWLRLHPGQVTDDTTMALALGRAILASNGAVEAQSVASAFDDWMRSKPVDIGNTVRRGIVSFRQTGSTEVAYSEHGAGNGACMRCLPVALATLQQSAEAVVRASRVQAHVTHHNALSDAGCECVITMVQLAVQGANRLDMLHGPVHALVNQYPQFQFRERRQQNPTGFIVDTLRAVFDDLFGSDGFEQCLVSVVNRGGDADTTGAIAGMIAGALYGVDGIPARWLKVLDAQVRAECERQALALLHHAYRPAG